MRRITPLLLAATLGVLAALLVACGGGGKEHLIPAGDAQQLSGSIGRVGDMVAAGDCDGLAALLSQAQDEAQSLPAGVSKRLQARIEKGIGHLERTAPRQCSDNAELQEGTTETSTEPEQTQTETTETETQTTDTQTTETETQTTGTDTTGTQTETQTTGTQTTPTQTQTTTTGTTPTQTTPPPPTGGTPAPPGGGGNEGGDGDGD